MVLKVERPNLSEHLKNFIAQMCSTPNCMQILTTKLEIKTKTKERDGETVFLSLNLRRDTLSPHRVCVKWKDSKHKLTGEK